MDNGGVFLRKLFFSAVAILVCIMLVFQASGIFIVRTMPEYKDALGNDNYTEKITGLYLLEQSADRDDNIIIYGSSELRTLNISTHPANFFAGKRCGFQVNLVGRGSCQSIIHAISIAASGDALTGKKIVLITSPQSFVEEGITPDMFLANFSEQQYLELMAAEDISDDIKEYISGRVTELSGRYEELTGSNPQKYTAAGQLAAGVAKDSAASRIKNVLLTPYYMFSTYLAGLKDKLTAKELIQSVDAEAVEPERDESIDWQAEESAALAEAVEMTDNNDFGILNDYYNTYIGRKLIQQKDKDSALSYSVSQEYDDLRVLFEICSQKGIEPLFVHVPLHGEWSDYTGFTAERRAEYYQNVRDIVAEYGVEMLDLTGYEYEEYFLCDIMHLGWKGWLEVDKALVRYFNGD